MTRFSPFKRLLLLLSVHVLWGALSALPACTGLFYGQDKLALVGNNEDWMSPFTRIWYLPAEAGKFGRVYFGFAEGGFQGGMNDQGLFFDGYAVKPLELAPEPGKEIYPGNLAQKVMETCRSVEEVIDLFERYDRSGLAGAQQFFADRNGNSVIIEARAIIRKSGPWQLVTNFRQSETAGDLTIDSRYCIGRQMVERERRMDLTLMRRILAATHQEGKYPTQYSNICDLKNGTIRLFHFHNFENEVLIDLDQELSKGRRVIELASLFSENHAAKAYRREIEKAMSERLAPYKVVAPNAEMAASWAGDYPFSGAFAGYTLSVRMAEGKIMADIPDFLEPIEMLPLSDDEYIINGLEEVFKFKFARDAAVERVKVSWMGMETEAIKNSKR